MMNPEDADKYITFIEEGTSKSGKTKVVTVFSHTSADIIGTIKWHGAWRHYCFFPESQTIFSDRCLARIAQEVEKLNNEHKKG